MKAEHWELLNGSGWGDEPRAFGESPCIGEVEIPGFMFETTQSVLVPAAAYYAQGVGRVKRQVRAEKKQRRDFRNGVVWMGAVCSLLVLANLLMEVICR